MSLSTMNTCDNILSIASTKLPNHIFDIIMSFFTGTPSSIAITKYLRYMRKKDINKCISYSRSRNTNFLFIGYTNYINVEIDVDNNGEEHWIFGNDDVQLQARNCKKCGNYKDYFNFPHTNKILCDC
jgi:hypothetical protein